MWWIYWKKDPYSLIPEERFANISYSVHFTNKINIYKTQNQQGYLYFSYKYRFPNYPWILAHIGSTALTQYTRIMVVLESTYIRKYYIPYQCVYIRIALPRYPRRLRFAKEISTVRKRYRKWEYEYERKVYILSVCI